MENYNELESLKDRMLGYASPLDLEAEWLALTDKKAVAKKNIIQQNPMMSLLLISIIGIGLFVGTYTGKDTQFLVNEDIIVPNLINNEIQKAGILTTISNERSKQSSISEEVVENRLSIKNSKEEGRSSVKKEEQITPRNSKVIGDFENKNPIAKSTDEVVFMMPISNTEESEELITTGKKKSILLEDVERKEINRQAISVKEKEIMLLDPLTSYERVMVNQQLPTLNRLTRIFKDSIETTDYFKNSIRLELAGQGGFYSLNYERLLHQNEKWRTYGHVGAAYNPSNLSIIPEGAFDLFIPFGITRTRVLQPNNHLEVGIGQTLINDQSAEKPYRYFLTGNLKIGYRYQSEDSRFMFNIFLLQNVDYNNLFERNRTDPINLQFSFWGGIGFGYRF